MFFSTAAKSPRPGLPDGTRAHDVRAHDVRAHDVPPHDIRAHDIRLSQQIDEAARIRATARMQQIMTMPPAGVGAAAVSSATIARGLAKPNWWASRHPTSRQFAVRLVAIPAVAAALVVASVLLPLPLGSGPEPAFATWTAVPSEVPAQLLEAATQTCTARLSGLTDRLGSASAQGSTGSLAPQLGQPTVAEQRGDWILLSHNATGSSVGFSGCLVRIVGGQAQLASGWVSDTWDGSGADSAVYGASNSTRALVTIVTPELSLSVVESDGTDIGESGTLALGWRTAGERGSAAPQHSGEFRVRAAQPTGIGTLMISENSVPDEGSLISFFAIAGDQVIGAEIQPVGADSVVATVTDGQIVAWWPGGTRHISAITLYLLDGTSREILAGELR